MLSRLWWWSSSGWLSTLLAAGLLPASGSATLLYASSYGGYVSTLNLTLPARGSGNRTGSLVVVAQNWDCDPQPSWLTLDSHTRTLYCVGEGLSTRNGSLSSFDASSEDGTLELTGQTRTLSGPVSSVIFGNDSRGLAVAHYTGSGISTFSINLGGGDGSAAAIETALSLVNARVYTGPLGPVKNRQNAPHPHQATLDPTSQFILLPDLGSDMVRVFRFNPSTYKLEPLSPLVVTPATGPRHLAFLKTEKKTFMYLVGELSNTITLYEVGYGTEAAAVAAAAASNGGRDVPSAAAATTIQFKEISRIGTHGLNGTVPSGSTAAEIQISPDKRFLMVSSRYELAFQIPSFDDPSNSTATIASDTLVSFSIDRESGALTRVQEFPAGGRTPRHFSLNGAGDMVAVGLQDDGRVVVIERDVGTGLLKGFLAAAAVDDGVTCVLFDEPPAKQGQGHH